MNYLRFHNQEQSFRSSLPVASTTKFRYYELDENSLFKADDKEYVHFLFLLDGEIRISGVKSTKTRISSQEFFFIPNSRFVCRAVKKTKFLLFSIYRFHYQSSKCAYNDIVPVVRELRYHHAPLTTPPLLSMFLDILADYLKRGLNSPALQQIKQEELFYILRSLYDDESDGDFSDYGMLSLS